MPEAIEHFETSLKIRPNQADALINLAGAYAVQSRFQDAIDKFKAALRISPNDSGIYFNFGLCFQQQGTNSEAVKMFRKVLSIDPGHRKAKQALQQLLRSNN